MIQCPSCGSTDPSDFQILDETVCGWQVLEFEDALIKANGLYEAYESVNNERLYCSHTDEDGYNSCGTSFPIPEGVKVDYV